MKARTKFLIGGLLVLGPVGYLMASSIKETGVYYLTPTELSSKPTSPGGSSPTSSYGPSSPVRPAPARRTSVRASVVTPGTLSPKVAPASTCLL